jgi:hypothetical protein
MLCHVRTDLVELPSQVGYVRDELFFDSFLRLFLLFIRVILVAIRRGIFEIISSLFRGQLRGFDLVNLGIAIANFIAVAPLRADNRALIHSLFFLIISRRDLRAIRLPVLTSRWIVSLISLSTWM